MLRAKSLGCAVSRVCYHRLGKMLLAFVEGESAQSWQSWRAATGPGEAAEIDGGAALGRRVYPNRRSDIDRIASGTL